MHRSKVFSSVSFDNYLYSCDHQSSKDKDHVHHPTVFLWATFRSAPSLKDNQFDFYYYRFTLSVLESSINGTILYVLIVSDSFTQQNGVLPCCYVSIISYFLLLSSIQLYRDNNLLIFPPVDRRIGY